MAGQPRRWRVRSSYKNVGKGTPTVLLWREKGGGVEERDRDEERGRDAGGGRERGE